MSMQVHSCTCTFLSHTFVLILYNRKGIVCGSFVLLIWFTNTSGGKRWETHLTKLFSATCIKSNFLVRCPPSDSCLIWLMYDISCRRIYLYDINTFQTLVVQYTVYCCVCFFGHFLYFLISVVQYVVFIKLLKKPVIGKTCWDEVTPWIIWISIIEGCF